jgi:hypothetical protein
MHGTHRTPSVGRAVGKSNKINYVSLAALHWEYFWGEWGQLL